MSNTSSKVIGVVVCLAIAAYSGTKVLNSNNSIFTSTIGQHPVANPLREADATSNVSNPTTSAKPVDVSKQMATTDVLDYKSWSEERGYISGQDMAVYQGYDPQTLERLAASGDVRAIDALAAIAVKQGDIEKAKMYYWQAGVLGSTTAIGHLALLTEQSSFMEMSYFDRKQKIIETLAILKLAEIRGDIRAATVVSKGVIANYESSFGSLVFSEEESARLRERAQQLYEELSSRRREMGLDDFDNSTPALLKEMYKTK